MRYEQRERGYNTSNRRPEDEKTRAQISNQIEASTKASDREIPINRGNTSITEVVFNNSRTEHCTTTYLTGASIEIVS